jgi:hypothetical protein
MPLSWAAPFVAVYLISTAFTSDVIMPYRRVYVKIGGKFADRRRIENAVIAILRANGCGGLANVLLAKSGITRIHKVSYSLVHVE